MSRIGRSARAAAIIRSRMELVDGMSLPRKRTLEGGCGVIGIIGTAPLPGRHIIRPCEQMRNRGNGKGGGVAAAGLFPEHKDRYALHLAYLDESVRGEVEREILSPTFELAEVEEQPTVDDHREVGLEMKPPAVCRYFVRLKESEVSRFAERHGIASPSAAEDELLYQTSFRLNRQHYVGGERPRAFVLSHGRDLMILKGVGYAEEIARYYRLEDVTAHTWIGHQRYPTRGRVWHPGGAHPFAGLHEALVHNGDFANYHATTEYLRQLGLVPLFVTDTEVSVLLFDLYSRVLGYPLELVIEALGPTPEGDFERLSKRRQRIYRAIQTAHLHGSPDGPWFFIVTRCDPETGAPQLIGITDVSMLRPQVFAVQRGRASFGAIASEKQAIDAFFESVSATDPRVLPVADRYWNARGGSCTDGGAFTFTVEGQGEERRLDVRDKFGVPVEAPRGRRRGEGAPSVGASIERSFDPVRARIAVTLDRAGPDEPESDVETEKPDAGSTRGLEGALATELSPAAEELSRDLRGGDVGAFLERVARAEALEETLAALTQLRDRPMHTEALSRAGVLSAVDRGIVALLDGVPGPGEGDASEAVRIRWEGAWDRAVPEPKGDGAMLVVDARGFPPEGRRAVSRLLVEAHRQGHRRLVVYGCRGDRFIGCGLGPRSDGLRIDVYGSSGDYLGSGMDGAHVYVHGDAQDQVGQILKAGRIVVFGSVGQTFLYGAKGGEAFVAGNAAGRPLINAVGRIRAIINGTCLDYCAESFMAGEELDGGFVVINGLALDDQGVVVGLETKYPGNNLFSLASGGACYLNDPYMTVSEAQLNGASFVPFKQADWSVLRPYLQLNEELFGFSIRYDLLQVDGKLRWPKEVFRKVVASPHTVGLDWSGLPM